MHPSIAEGSLEGVLIDLAEQVKANDARCADRTARAEELATIALQTIAAVSQELRALTQELRALTQEFRGFAKRTDDRLGALEKATAAE